MNTFTAVDVSYLKPSRTIETILLENGDQKKIVYVYNFEGKRYYVFNFIVDLLKFFNNELDEEISFDSDQELDSYLANLNLEHKSDASEILANYNYY